MRKFIAPCLLFLALASMYAVTYKGGERYLRPRVVKLTGGMAMCSGEQIIAPSGVNYILSAAHCNVLARDGVMEVVTEDGDHIKRRVIAEDPTSDLLLIEGLPNLQGIKVAEANNLGQHVRTLTHGSNMATHTTTGTLIEEQSVAILAFMINNPDDAARCASAPKYKPFSDGFNTGCLLMVRETVTDALITPGSSGGMAVDNSGRLIGVVSAGSERFGLLVPLEVIHKFLAGY